MIIHLFHSCVCIAGIRMTVI